MLSRSITMSENIKPIDCYVYGVNWGSEHANGGQKLPTEAEGIKINLRMWGNGEFWGIWRLSRC